MTQSQLEPRAQAFVEHYYQQPPQARRERHIEADYFCADEHSANQCALLVAQGIKRATCSLEAWYQPGAERRPEKEDWLIVTDWSGSPVALVEITRVESCAFADVDAEFAAAEGEGDTSLAAWQAAHWAFFSRDCSELGLTPDPQMMLVQEHFQLLAVHPAYSALLNQT